MSKNQPIQDAEEVIERFGGIRPMAKKIDVAVTTVQGWKKRNVIPGGRRKDILAAAQTHNVDLSDIIREAAISTDPVANENTEKKKPISANTPPTAPTPQKPAPSPEMEKPLDLKIMEQGSLQQKLKATEAKAVTKSIIITVILIALTCAAAYVLFAPGYEPAGTDKIDALESQLDAVKEEQGFLSLMIPEDLNQRLTHLQEQTGAALENARSISGAVFDGNAEALEQRVMRLERHLASMGASSTVMGSVLERFRIFQESPDGQEILDRAVSELNMLMSDLGDYDGALEAVLENARGQSNALGQTFNNVPGNDLKAAAMLLGMTQLRASLNRGNTPFEEDMQLLINLAGEENPELVAALERLAPQAEDGVLTPAGLSTEFRGLTGDIIVASLKGEDVSIKDKAIAKFNELFQVKKDGALVTGTPTQATVERAQVLLEEGDVQAAIVEVETLEGPAAEAAMPWLKQAKATLTAQRVKALVDDIVNNRILGSQLIQDEEAGINILRQGPPVAP